MRRNRCNEDVQQEVTREDDSGQAGQEDQEELVPPKAIDLLEDVLKLHPGGRRSERPKDIFTTKLPTTAKELFFHSTQPNVMYVMYVAYT